MNSEKSRGATSRRFVLLLTLALAWSTVARGQVQLGNVAVTLGEPRAAVLARLNAEYRVDSMGFVWKRDGPPFEVLGTIGFTKDRLTYLTRSWDLGARDERGVFEAVIRSLSQLTDRQCVWCMHRAGHTRVSNRKW